MKKSELWHQYCEWIRIIPRKILIKNKVCPCLIMEDERGVSAGSYCAFDIDDDKERERVESELRLYIKEVDQFIFIRIFDQIELTALDNIKLIIDLCNKKKSKKHMEWSAVEQKNVCCSICGRKRSEVKKLISGNGVAICDICCNQMISYNKIKSNRCNFCDIKKKRNIIKIKDISICCNCLDLALKIIYEEEKHSNDQDQG